MSPTPSAASPGAPPRRPAVFVLAIWANPHQYPATLNTAHILAEKGHRVIVIGRQSPGDAVAEPIDIPNLSFRFCERSRSSPAQNLLCLLSFTWICLSECLRNRPASVIGYDNFGLIAAWLCRVLIRKTRLIYHCHDVCLPVHKASLGGVAWFLENILAKTADLIVLPDALRGRHYARLMRLRDEPMTIPNAPRLRSAASPVRTRLADIVLEAADNQIVMRHGSIGPGHSFEATIASLPYWPEGSIFLAIGPGAVPYRDSLRRMAESLGVSKRLHFLPPVGYPAILDLICGAQVGCAFYDGRNPLGPCAFAGTASNKALEFLAAGVPFVVDTHPASAIFVEQGVAIAVPPDQPKAIGHAIADLLGNPSRRAAMAARARDLHQRQLHFEKGFAPLENFLLATSHGLDGETP